MPTHQKRRRRLSEIMGSDIVQAFGEAQRKYPYTYYMLKRWAREGRIRFYGEPATLYCPEFEKDVREGLPVKYKDGEKC